MSITVPFDLSYELEVRAGIDEVYALLADVPASASHFPHVERLVDLGRNTYRWELEKVGTEQVNIHTVYASKYVCDRRKRTVSWTPVPGVGNAQIAGEWTLTRRKNSTHALLHIHGEIGVSLPALMKLIVVPVVEHENERLVRQYLHNLAQSLGGEA